MTEISFREAVERSKKLLLSGLTSGFAPTADGEYMQVAFEPPLARTTLGVNMLRKKPDELLAWAESEAEGFDTAKMGIAYALEQSETLPDAARLWLAKVLRGEVSRPKAKAGRREKEWLNLLICIAIQHRVADGMDPTRNDASDPLSACDAVAEALAELGLTPTTFDSVKRIWKRMNKNTFRAIKAT